MTLPPWRTDNIYSFIWALVIAVVTATSTAMATYYNMVRTMDRYSSTSESDIKLIKQDVAFIRDEITKNAVLSEKKLDEHIKMTSSKIQELDQLALKVAAMAASLKY